MSTFGLWSCFSFALLFQSLCCLRCPPKAVTDPPRKESPPSIVTYENTRQSFLFLVSSHEETSYLKIPQEFSGSDSHVCPKIKGGFCSGIVTKKGTFWECFDPAHSVQASQARLRANAAPRVVVISSSHICFA